MRYFIRYKLYLYKTHNTILMRSTRYTLFIAGLLCICTHSNAQIITTIAGTGTSGYTGDGSAATAATMNTPSAIAMDGAGNIYIADRMNHAVRKITPAGNM